jgi:hypothetical protein
MAEKEKIRGIILIINGEPIMMSIEEARNLYTELHGLFGNSPIWWTTNTYPQIYLDNSGSDKLTINTDPKITCSSIEAKDGKIQING